MYLVGVGESIYRKIRFQKTPEDLRLYSSDKQLSNKTVKNHDDDRQEMDALC